MTNVIFHHLPKTGGRSIKDWLANRGLSPEVINKYPIHRWYQQIIESQPPLKRIWPCEHPIVAGHDTYSNLGNLFGWTCWEEVTVLRNPAERILSHYHHEAKKGLILEDFEAWAGGYPEWKICSCMWCITKMSFHTRNPMTWFYASKQATAIPINPLEQARKTLNQCIIYPMEDLPSLALDLASLLHINASDYHPKHVTGSGASITQEQRDFLYLNHPLDVQLWDEYVNDVKPDSYSQYAS